MSTLRLNNSPTASLYMVGRALGPKILTHVKCGGCGRNYNGKTGKDNKTGIIIYSLVVGMIVLGLVGVMFVALFALMYATS